MRVKRGVKAKDNMWFPDGSFLKPSFSYTYKGNELSVFTLPLTVYKYNIYAYIIYLYI